MVVMWNVTLLHINPPPQFCLVLACRKGGGGRHMQGILWYNHNMYQYNSNVLVSYGKRIFVHVHTAIQLDPTYTCSVVTNTVI